MSIILDGTITFLFTDIEGSTQLWEQQPEAMQTALARHDTILRGAIESHHGRVFKTVGDAFCATFASASDAVLAAQDIQQQILAENWSKTVIRVRVGLHSGPAEQRDNDYFGPTLNRVARLMSAGHGGQILLSAATRELVQANLPDGIELRDMGERGLKDLIRPEHIYQVVAPGLAADFPPLKTLDTFRTNLPVQLTSFIGREKEIAAVKKLIVEHRLVTLTGSGGTGKTRLSLQVAASLLDAFPDGVWFVELAPLADPALVPQTVLTTMGLREDPARSVIEMLSQYLQARKVLLILDNCEHLVQAAAQLVETLAHACQNLRILASSREALGIPGEHTFPVRSLSTPKTEETYTAENLAQYEAARLFAERAKSAAPAFSLTSANAPSIAQICARLDGIPLAIELAAARVKMLKPEQIAERLDDRFRLLTGGSRTALPRQQTLRAMIDWSYDLLPEPERVLLRRLSVFAGGWTLEAAETVCQGPGIDDYNVLDPLANLVNKSLVVVDAEEENAETRYHLLETVRQYAREKLSESGEGIAMRDAHLQYFLGLAEQAEPELVGPHEPEWQKRLGDEFDNIRAALEWSIKRDAQVGLRLASAMDRFRKVGDVRAAMSSSISTEKANWLKQLLQQPTASSRNAARAKALVVLSHFGETPAIRGVYAEESLAIYQELGDESGIASALSSLGFSLCLRGNYGRGHFLIFESLTLYRKLGDKVGMASTLFSLGYSVESNHVRASAYLKESLELYRTLGFFVRIADVLEVLGRTALFAEDYDLARASLLEASEIYRKLGIATIWLKRTLGEMVLHQGKYQEARTYLEEHLLLSREYGYYDPFGTFHLGYAVLRQGDQMYARLLFKEILQTKLVFYETLGRVCALEGFASLAVAQGQHKQATHLFAFTDATRAGIDNPRPPVEQADVDHDLAIIRAHLDEAAFAAAQEAGRAMSMDEAIALAFESTHE